MTRAVIARFAASRIPKRGGNWRPPRWKKEQPPWLEHTMLQVRDGARFVGGTFGPRGWHDCQLLLCGIRLDCRAGRDIPEGRVVDGASVVRKADGWYAAVRIARQPRRAIEPTRAEVGLCLGLLALAVTSDNECWVNPRGNEYSKLCAYMQEQQAEASDPNAAWDLGARRRRYQLRMQRRTREIILAEILPTLARYSTIVLGTLSRQDVQGPQCRLSGEDDDGGALSAAGALRSLIKERFRERVVEIDLPGVDDVSPDETARKLLAKYWEIKSS